MPSHPTKELSSHNQTPSKSEVISSKMKEIKSAPSPSRVMKSKKSTQEIT